MKTGSDGAAPKNAEVSLRQSSKNQLGGRADLEALFTLRVDWSGGQGDHLFFVFFAAYPVLSNHFDTFQAPAKLTHFKIFHKE